MASAQTVTPVFPSSCAFIYLLLYLLIQPFIDSSIHPFTRSSTHPFFSSSVHTFIFFHLSFIIHPIFSSSMHLQYFPCIIHPFFSSAVHLLSYSDLAMHPFTRSSIHTFFIYSRKRPRRVPSKKALPLKIVIKDCHQTSPKVKTLFKACHLKIVIKDCPKFC